MNDVNLISLMHGTISVLAALISASLPYLIIYLERQMKIKQSAAVEAMNAAAQATIQKAVENAAGVSYAALAAAPKGYTDPVVMNSALAAGLNHVVASIPDTLASLGITQDTIISMVQGKLGALLAVDPNVSAGTTLPPASPAPAPVPAPTPVPVSVIGMNK